MGALCAPEWGRLGFGDEKKRTPTEVGVQISIRCVISFQFLDTVGFH